MKPDLAEGLTCRLPLPADFRQQDFLAFHARDPHRRAERIGPDSMEKGFIWQGQAVRLHLHFDNGTVGLQLSKSAEASAGAPPERDLRPWASRFLGLDQPITAFEACWRGHPLIGPLITATPGLRIPQTATPFEALSWAITGQQISLAAALSLRGRLIEACARRCGDLACYPDASALLTLTSPQLTAIGFSRSKAGTLLDVAARVESGALPLDDWWHSRTPPDLIRDRLLAIRGIGPWTVDYTLLRGFGHADASLQGDAAVRRSLKALLGQPERPGLMETARWLEDFAPWRALVAAHLWRV